MMRAAEAGLLLYAVGDVAPDRDDPRECFARVRDELRRADIGFCPRISIATRGRRSSKVREASGAPQPAHGSP